MAAVAPSGGNCQLTLDETGKYPNLSHPEFEPATKKFLRGLLPEFLDTSNPLDFSGIPDMQVACPKIMRAAADDANVDIVVGVVRTNHYPTMQGGGERKVADGAAEIAASTDKLVVLLTATGGEPPARARQGPGPRRLAPQRVPGGLSSARAARDLDPTAAGPQGQDCTRSGRICGAPGKARRQTASRQVHDALQLRSSGTSPTRRLRTFGLSKL